MEIYQKKVSRDEKLCMGHYYKDGFTMKEIKAHLVRHSYMPRPGAERDKMTDYSLWKAKKVLPKGLTFTEDQSAQESLADSLRDQKKSIQMCLVMFLPGPYVSELRSTAVYLAVKLLKNPCSLGI